jgi:hypothetical protein
MLSRYERWSKDIKGTVVTVWKRSSRWEACLLGLGAKGFFPCQRCGGASLEFEMQPLIRATRGLWRCPLEDIFYRIVRCFNVFPCVSMCFLRAQHAQLKILKDLRGECHPFCTWKQGLVGGDVPWWAFYRSPASPLAQMDQMWSRAWRLALEMMAWSSFGREPWKQGPMRSQEVAFQRTASSSSQPTNIQDYCASTVCGGKNHKDLYYGPFVHWHQASKMRNKSRRSRSTVEPSKINAYHNISTMESNRTRVDITFLGPHTAD